MFDNEGYLGFTFAGHHSSEFGLMVVSDGSRYHQNLFNNFSDTLTSVPGKNGSYYFGTQLQVRDFDIQCVFDDMTTHTRNKIQTWLYPNKVGWLIYDEMPYKKYLVKISGVPSFNFLPFDKTKFTSKHIIKNEILKGELDIPFFTFREFGIRNEKYEVPNVYNDTIITQELVDSGIIPDNYNISPILLSDKKPVDIEVVGSNQQFSIYNAGNGVSDATFSFFVDKYIFDDGNPIEITNQDDNQKYIINDFATGAKEFEDLTHDRYKIIINGEKKEIYAIPYNGEIEEKDRKKDLGAFYNHYFPKIYHKKPNEILIVNQSRENEKTVEPLFYPASYITSDFNPSDSSSLNDKYTFKEFKNYWSDYMICTRRRAFEINDVINPALLNVNLEGDNFSYNPEEIVYLIYPNKFVVNKTIKNFVPQYEDTYI